MTTASPTLRNGFAPNGGAVWAIVPTIAAVGAWMMAPPINFDGLGAMSIFPTAVAESAVETPVGGNAVADELMRDVSLAADPQPDGSPRDGLTVLGLTVGKPRRYNVDYRVFGSGNRASYDLYVDGIETIDGKPYYKVTTVLNGTPRDRTEVMWYRTEADGVHRRFTVRDKTYEMIWYPAPFRVGQEYKTEVDGIKHVARCEGVDEIVVNGEKLKCLRISLDGTLGRSVEWVAPGRGVVKVSQKAKIYSAEVVVDPSAVVPERESIALND